MTGIGQSPRPPSPCYATPTLSLPTSPAERSRPPPAPSPTPAFMPPSPCPAHSQASRSRPAPSPVHGQDLHTAKGCPHALPVVPTRPMPCQFMGKNQITRRAPLPHCRANLAKRPGNRHPRKKSGKNGNLHRYSQECHGREQHPLSRAKIPCATKFRPQTATPPERALTTHTACRTLPSAAYAGHLLHNSTFSYHSQGPYQR